MAGSKKDQFVVADLVQAVSTDGKPLRLLKGDVITENVSSDSVDLLKSLGYLSDVSPLMAPPADDSK